MIRILSVVAAMMFLTACVNSNEQKLEEVRILLDEQQYAAAVEKAREVVAEEPDNQEAQLLLASSLLGAATLDATNGCRAEDTGVLGKLACLLDERSANESELETFLRIAPLTANIPALEEATDIFVSVAPNVADVSEQKSVYLKLYLARLFEIGGAISRVTITPGTICDGINVAELTSDQNTRFRENLTDVNSNGQSAGLPTDFALNDRITELNQRLEVLDSVPDFLQDQLNSATATGDCN